MAPKKQAGVLSATQHGHSSEGVTRAQNSQGTKVASVPAAFMAVSGIYLYVTGRRLPTSSCQKCGKERNGKEKDYASVILDRKYSCP